jgi:hypothetical protein
MHYLLYGISVLNFYSTQLNQFYVKTDSNNMYANIFLKLFCVVQVVLIKQRCCNIDYLRNIYKFMFYFICSISICPICLDYLFFDKIIVFYKQAFSMTGDNKGEFFGLTHRLTTFNTTTIQHDFQTSAKCLFKFKNNIRICMAYVDLNEDISFNFHFTSNALQVIKIPL